MNEPFENIRELTWREQRSNADDDAQRAWLAAHPEAASALEEEQALSRVISALPDVPVASNFTARVLQQVEREPVRPVGARSASGNFLKQFHWLPNAAVATLALFLGFFTFRHLEHSSRAKLAESVVVVSTVPKPELFEDFEAIRRLSVTPAADEELLALMQ